MQVSGEKLGFARAVFKMCTYIFMAIFKPLVSTLQFVDRNVSYIETVH